MKLSDYAMKLGIQYRTAWNHFNAGKIPGAYQLPTGTIIVPDPSPPSQEAKAAVYARVSSSQNELPRRKRTGYQLLMREIRRRAAGYSTL